MRLPTSKGGAVSAVMAFRNKGERTSPTSRRRHRHVLFLHESQIRGTPKKYEAVTAKNSENGKRADVPKRAGRGKKKNTKTEKAKAEGFFRKTQKKVLIMIMTMIKIMIMIMLMTMTLQTMIMKRAAENSGGGRFEEFWREYPKTECCQGKKGL